ncbi:hypothetical protein ACTGVI_12300, partial [Streptococcus suis]
AVGLQCVALSYVTLHLRSRIARQDIARRDSDAMAAVAESEREIARVERERAVVALEAARVAEAQAAVDREVRRLAEARSEKARRAQLVNLAAQFEARVVEVAVAIEAASSQLEGSATTL